MRSLLSRVGGALFVVGLLAACSSAPAPAAVPSGSASVSTRRIDRIVLPPDPRVYFFGDSFTHGTSAARGRGFPQVVGAALGWKVVLGPDNSGAGFVNTYEPRHPVFPRKVSELHPFRADLIVVEGGANDVPGPLDHFWNTAKGTLRELQRKAGGAPVVLVGPTSIDGLPPDGMKAVDFQLAGVADQLRIPYVSPLAERWFNPKNVSSLIDPITLHPTTAGHAYYGGRLAGDLMRLTISR